jgi:peptidoglycan hydrolase-like amidase
VPTSRALVPRAGFWQRSARTVLGALLVAFAFVLPAAQFGPAPTAAASVPSDSTNVNIDMQENDGLDVIVQGFGGGVSAPGVSNAPAIRFQQSLSGTWNVDIGGSCGGPWTQASANQSGPITASPAGGLLMLCVASYSPTVYGTLTATYNSGGAARTVNSLPLERYVADTVPGESPSSWGTLGGSGPQGMPWGFQELEAQAIAVRSYVLANVGGYGGYADTCDLFCQTYRGVEYETPTSIAAANDTAGQVMVMPGGQIATTEYSASTGGYTSSNASGQSPFTAVPDDGDAVCVTNVVCNPYHNLPGSVSYSAIQAAWPQIGTFTGFSNPVEDPGRASDFPCCGRMDTITLDGTAGNRVVSGAAFYTTLGVKSDLFNVNSINGSTVSLTTQGYGHGIGMGQYGALGYAIGADHGDGNWTYSQIVNHFYQPASLESLSNITQVGGNSGGVGGYWVNATDGGVFSFGNAQFHGSTGGMRLNQPVVGMAATRDAGGYWEVASDGGVFSFGDAHFMGSTGSIVLNKPMVGMAVTPDGGGYWLVASDGGIFAYGDAQFHGSTGSIVLNKPIIGMVPTHDGGGYWLIASDGGVFAFGDAGFFGSLGGAPPATALVGVAPTPDGGGYWVLGANGTVYPFGDAPQLGVSAVSPGLGTMRSPMTGLIPDFSGQGFDAVNGSGQVFAFGDAPWFGDVTTAVPGYSGHAVGIAVTPS